MPTAAKEEKFSAPMVWTDECVLPLAASGVYPKTRVWGSREKTLPCFRATAQLSGISRRGCENSSGETTAGSALDANGNTTSKTDSTGTTTYSWDYDNRLASVTLPGQGGIVSYRYDPLGHRIYKSSSAGTSVFAYDGDNLIEETNSSGAAVARYSQGLNIDEPLAMLRSATISYYHADGVGSLTSLSNTSGGLANTYTYDSFGNLVASSGSIVNSFRYTGREWDPETSLYYYRARYYDPTTGRFLGEDPIAFEGDVNFYPLGFNSPTNYVDPYGLKKQRITVASVKADENAVLNILGRPECWKFISDAIKKTFNMLNNQALERGFNLDARTLKGQSDSNDLVNFAMTMFLSNIDISNRYPNYGAHVAFPGGSTIHIDLGYEGPLDLVHETFHLAPYGFSDTDLAEALGAPYAVDPRSPQKTIENASAAWNCLLEKACKQ